GVDDDVARQQESDLRFRRECAVRERGIAGTEYDIRPEVDVELRLQGRTHIDLGEHAEPFRRECFTYSGYGLVVRSIERGSESIRQCQLRHCHLILLAFTNSSARETPVAT